MQSGFFLQLDVLVSKQFLIDHGRLMEWYHFRAAGRSAARNNDTKSDVLFQGVVDVLFFPIVKRKEPKKRLRI